MAVDGCDLESASGKSALLCSCFIILETTISTLSSCEDGHSGDNHKFFTFFFFFFFFFFALSNIICNVCCFVLGCFGVETVLQLQTALNESFSSVVFLLELASTEMSETEPESAAPSSSNGSSSSDMGSGIRNEQSVLKYPIVAAALRVLGAWLAEDDLSLTEDVYKLLPFLLRLTGSARPCGAGSKKEEEEEEDLLKFLLPGLCHLTADDKARPVLMRSGLPGILAGYMGSLALLLGTSMWWDRVM